jgi:deoxyribonuclease-4
MLAGASIGPVFSHVPYLANIASGDDALWQKTRDLIALDLERTAPIADCLVVHMGSSEASPGEVEERVIAALTWILEQTPTGSLILENMAGQGSQVGWDLAQIARILDAVGRPESTGVCLDVAHAFAAGYDVATAQGIDAILDMLGPGRLKLVHLNDSKAAKGSRIDRHWHIGQGRIGEEGMRAIITHPGLAGTPAVMETPKDAPDADERNMAVARRLATIELGGH